MPETNKLISDELKRHVERLETLGARMEKRALANGIRDEDVPRLVKEVCRENKALGREIA